MNFIYNAKLYVDVTKEKYTDWLCVWKSKG